MTYLAAAERTALCDLALELGPAAPTLCGGWDVKDLIAHLVLRDGSLSAVGIVVPPLSGLTDRGMARLERNNDFETLVKRLRKGPPVHSPFRLKPVDRLLNAMEYFVHHEDILRAQPEWKPRGLSPRIQDALWRGVKSAGRGLARNAKVGISMTRQDTNETVVLKGGERSVMVTGMPEELALFIYGRQDQARVELIGSDEDIALLKNTSLGV
ncbi:MAG TPA: TIGR03085 family metal-binding protein [Nocardioidaceae bacterium]|nr:TIGR03085 family metal-binding protein [Nocardioidaceae bacterium]